MTVAWAAITIVAWGCWLVPAQRAGPVDRSVVIAYVALANLLLSAVFAWLRLAGSVELPSLVDGLAIGFGGALWTLGGWCAFSATRRLGIARAMGIWSPLNIVVSLVWGASLFAEFADWNHRELALASGGVALLVGGLSAIIRTADETAGPSGASSGRLFAILAGILWGSYFLPIRWTAVSASAAMLPMAIGMFSAAAGVVVLRGVPWRAVRRTDAIRFMASGALWSAGNLGSLALMERIGTGRGFALAQLCLVLNALVGIYIMKTPVPGSRASRRVLVGCTLASAGGAALGFAR